MLFRSRSPIRRSMAGDKASVSASPSSGRLIWAKADCIGAHTAMALSKQAIRRRNRGRKSRSIELSYGRMRQRADGAARRLTNGHPQDCGFTDRKDVLT